MSSRPCTKNRRGDTPAAKNFSENQYTPVCGSVLRLRRDVERQIARE